METLQLQRIIEKIYDLSTGYNWDNGNLDRCEKNTVGYKPSTLETYTIHEVNTKSEN